MIVISLCTKAHCMKLFCLLSMVVLVPAMASADLLPVISNQPQSISGSGILSVASTNATGFQWRWNGTDIPNATNSTLSRSASDPVGYYMVVVKNAAGWVPSQLAYLSRGSGGYVPFSNYGNPNWQAQAISQFTGQPLTAGLAQVVAGPELDQMQPVGDTWDFSWYAGDPSMAGYFDMDDQLVPTVSPGQTVYYRVDLTYPALSGTYTQPSRTLRLVAGGGSYPTPSADAIRFPTWPEWPEPWWHPEASTATNQTRIPGETFSFSAYYSAYTDFGIPTAQWRKDGRPIAGATNFVQTFGGAFGGNYQSVCALTNVQAADAGTYDVEVFGNQWMVKPTIRLSVQLLNGPGLFLTPRFSGTNLVCDLLGVAGRNYLVQWSPDLVSWNDLFSPTNITGTVTFTNPLASDAARFYRARLLP